MSLILPGFADAMHRALARLQPATAGPVPIIHETPLHAVEDVDQYIVRYFDELREVHGWSFEAAQRETDIVTIHAYLGLNFALQGRTAFWVDEELAGLLTETTLDISGDVLRLPFPACAFIFDDPGSLELASAVVGADPDAQLRGAKIKVLTVYALELPPESGARGVRLAFTSDDLSGRRPHIATRDIPTADKRNLDEILDSHPQGLTSEFCSIPRAGRT